MKQMKITTLLLLISAFFLVQPAYAMLETRTSTATATIEKQKNDLKKEFKAEKRMAKLQKFFKKAIDFKDPVNKWMWFWIFGWGAGIVLSILAVATVTGGGFGAIWLLSSLCWLFGSVSLIIWLVKKFS